MVAWSGNIGFTKFMLLAALFVAGIFSSNVCSARPLTSKPSMAERHEQWMAQYGRVYKDAAEKEMRFNILKKNVEHIEAMNGLNRGYILGLNAFSDMSNEEFTVTHNGYKRHMISRLQQIPREDLSQSIIAAKDKNKLLTIKLRPKTKNYNQQLQSTETLPGKHQTPNINRDSPRPRRHTKPHRTRPESTINKPPHRAAFLAGSNSAATSSRSSTQEPPDTGHDRSQSGSLPRRSSHSTPKHIAATKPVPSHAVAASSFSLAGIAVHARRRKLKKEGAAGSREEKGLGGGLEVVKRRRDAKEKERWRCGGRGTERW
ncbi:hypothetical protein Droror1_Dr00005468 [Drosera rotundifolia]